MGYDSKQNIILDRQLFWFLKRGAQVDLAEPSALDMYVQHVITCGRTEDVRLLLERVKTTRLKQVLARLEHFLPTEVKAFWEDYIGSNQ